MFQAQSDSSPDLFVALSPLQNQAALNGEADWSAGEEWERYVKRQEALASMLTGVLHPDYFLDLLESHTIDPEDYLDEIDPVLDLIC